MFRNSVVVLVLIDEGAVEKGFQIWAVGVFSEVLQELVVLEPWEDFGHHVLR